ncbi:sugar efflux transporter [Snodgrassella alvi]|uniref:Sugar efflux transporter n=1 Tax=Snodgrassella alvi TaxID=1196083 RepID=A0ABD7Z5N6_9NEIS|nr:MULTISPECIES: sugar efflux transporter [Snodgrassella]AHN28107.1 Putative transport protein [Snodgrassella alvi wkB2]MBI0157812.1 sugar efflux transporter [Snodgrassella sp. W6238H11]MBI0160362.1 sugar efflux transporter [Snodgrassella sp. W6238H14]OOX81177.1 MFS transporter [Snodgrassella alvi]ORF02411.1 MFS transporter [Snodgrassella alvi]
MEENLAIKQKAYIILGSFLVAAFIIGIAGALQAPTLSRYLAEDVKVNPYQVGLFYSINAVAGIVISFLLAQYSDNKGVRRNIILFCCLMGIGNCITFAFSRQYFILVTVGIFFSAFTSAAMPQIFASAREYTDKTGRNVVVFNGILRAQLSLAWVIGPPLSFALAVNYGFTIMYLSAAAMFFVAMLIVFLCFPVIKRPASVTKKQEPKEKIFNNPNVILLFIASISMGTANMMYLIDMPLYIDDILPGSPSLPGHLMGIAAAIEIPAMLIASMLVPRFGNKNLICFAVICGIIFYIGMVSTQNEWMLIGLQFFNGLFIGIIASIGLIYFQDLLPKRTGVASTLFNNCISCSIILAGMLQGVISANFGHQSIYTISLAMVILSFILCLIIQPPPSAIKSPSKVNH